MIDLNTLGPDDGGTAFPIVCETQTGSMIVSGGSRHYDPNRGGLE